jgi:prepilin-type N-terminal cleavage/methylation domain-containing protein
MKSSSNKKGFTLVELLVAMGIIAMMAALSISAYPKFSDQLALTSDTYKFLSYFRETQSYGVSAVATPGVKFAYAFLVDKGNGTVSRVIIENPTSKTNDYYIKTAQTDPSAPIYTVKSGYNISDISGIKSGATTSLDKVYGFFRRPNPEVQLSGTVNTGTSYFPDSGTSTFDRVEVTFSLTKNPEQTKKIIILSTGQMYVNDW